LTPIGQSRFVTARIPDLPQFLGTNRITGRSTGAIGKNTDTDQEGNHMNPTVFRIFLFLFIALLSLAQERDRPVPAEA